MSTQTNAVRDPLESQQAVAPAATSATRPLYWSIRRELWENRSIYIAPLAVAGVFLAGFLISTIYLPGKMRAVMSLDHMKQHEVLAEPFVFAAGLLMAATFLVGIFYCLDAFQSERRDRSILFWKSLPVSDRTTVLAKAFIPLVVLPLLTFVLTVALHFIMLAVSSAVLAATGESVATLWRQLAPGQMWLLLLYHLVTVHALWYAPIYGWLLFVSAWAPRAAFLWAFLPPLAIGVLEKIAFNTSYFGLMLQDRMMGGNEAMLVNTPDGMPIHPMTQITPGRFLSSPGLWIGLALAAAFLLGAVRMRRSRGPV
jgi:ABC-2 type transport system permease protein